MGEASRGLIRAAYDRLYATAQRILRDRDAAEDAVQDAIVRCWRDLRGLRDPDRFEAWLYRLLVNACRDHDSTRATSPSWSSTGRSLTLRRSVDDFAVVGDQAALERAFLCRPLPISGSRWCSPTTSAIPLLRSPTILGVPHRNGVLTHPLRRPRHARGAVARPVLSGTASTEPSR